MPQRHTSINILIQLRFSSDVQGAYWADYWFGGEKWCALAERSAAAWYRRRCAENARGKRIAVFCCGEPPDMAAMRRWDSSRSTRAPEHPSTGNSSTRRANWCRRACCGSGTGYLLGAPWPRKLSMAWVGPVVAALPRERLAPLEGLARSRSCRETSLAVESSTR